MSASRLAARTSGMPWSCAAGMRCVPMRPLVDAPQMKNVAVSSQKSRERTPSPSAARATRAGLAPPPAAGSTRSPPNGGCRGRPAAREEQGDDREWRRPRRRPSRASRLASHDRRMIAARSGRKTSCPVAVLAVRRPIARPRRADEPSVDDGGAEHQRHHPAAGAHQETPRPARAATAGVTWVARATPVASSVRAPSVVRRMPRRCMRPPANGPINP